MKAQGLLAGVLAATLMMASVVTAQDVSVFTVETPELEDRFGIEVTGTFGMFALSDINDYFLLNTSRNYSVEEAQFGVGGGGALLYRSHENFRWHIGYMFLGQETASASYFDPDDNVTYTDEQTVTGSELYVSGNYLIHFTDLFHLYFGAGVSLVNAEFDRALAQSTGIYDADGRSFGAKLVLGGEFQFHDNWALTGAAGYRYAKVGEVAYQDRTLVDEEGNPLEQTVYWGSGNRKISVDFSGVYAELGLRLYFAPATNWFRD